MAEKNLNARIVLKHDVEENWLKATNFIPKRGEVIIYDTDASYDYERIKIGDGTTLVSALPFVDDAVKSSIELLSSSIEDVDKKADSISTLVGDTSVSTQISTAIANDKCAITATSDDGIAYTATIPGITELTAGISFIMIPGRASASTQPTLNVNGLGAKPIRRRLSNITTALQAGYSNTWLASKRPFRLIYDASGTGNWIVEGQNKPAAADLYGAVAKATGDAEGNNIIETYATIAMLQNMLPKVTNITLGTTWNGSASPYYQDIALDCVTETSMVDIQPTPAQLASWQDDGLAFTTMSYAGTVRVYVAGGMPTESITVQVKVQEVTVI